MSFWDELKRRNVFRVGVAYAAVAWLLMQVSSTVLETFEAPAVANQVFLVFLILGFPLALLLAWAYELTPAGVKRTADVQPAESITRQTGQKLNYAIITVLSLAVVLLILDNYVLTGSESETSIAVLPFDNLSEDADQDRFAGGFTREVHNSLAQIQDLTVVSVPLEFSAPGETLTEIAGTFGVNYLLTGSVDPDGDEMRIHAELIRADDGSNVWSRPYEGAGENPRELMIGIAEAVAERLSATFGIGDFDRALGGTDVVEAYDHYLLAQGHAYRSGAPGADARAIDEYRQALELDPEFGLAQLGLAYGVVFSTRGIAGLPANPNPEVRAQIEAFIAEVPAIVERARELMPDHPTMMLTDAIRLIDAREYADAEDLLRARLEISGRSDYEGNNWLGHLYLQTGRIDDAIRYLSRARDLEPVRAGPVLQLSLAYDALGDLGQSRSLFEASKEMVGFGPLSIPSQYWRLLTQGEEQQARALIDDEFAEWYENEDFNSLFLDASIVELKAEFENGIYENASYLSRLAQTVALRGDSEFAFRIWSQLLPRNPTYLQFTWPPWMAGVRRHPEFPLLMRQLGLREYWQTHGWPEHCGPAEPEGFECD